MVMVPEVEDVGVWRMETHGIHAATELMGAVGLVELATTRGIWVPATLAIEERRRLVDGKTKRFIVPVVGFRGALAEVLPRLGITGPDFAPLGGVEPRPALDAGGAAALDAAPEPIGVEEATIPPADVAEPEPFEPPERERDPEEERGAMSWAQLAAMRATEAGIDDDARHGLWLAVTGGRTSSGADLDGLERAYAMAAIVRITRAEAALARANLFDGDVVWAVIAKGAGAERSTMALPDGLELTIVAPEPYRGHVWTAPGADGATATPEAARSAPEPPPAPTGTEEPPAPPEAPPAASAPSPAATGGVPGTDAEWRAFLRSAKTRIPDAIRIAAGLAPTGVAPPRNLPELVANAELAVAVYNAITQPKEG